MMKSQFTAWILLICFAALPAAAEDQKKQDTVIGLWHVQVIDSMGEKMLLGPSFSMQMDFGKDGRASVMAKMGDEDGGRQALKYVHDEQAATIKIYELDEEENANEEPDSVINYSFIDGMLVFRFKEENESVTMELTRKPEGIERHKAMREKEGDKAGEAIRAAREGAQKMQSMTQMRGLLQAALIFSNSNKRVYPPSLGHMMAGEYFTPDYVLTPWTKAKVPDDFDDWQEQKKIDWANQNTGYVYLLAGKKERLDREQLGIFELPRSADQKEIRLGFEDNSIRPLPYAEADKLIKKQTGHTIADWLKTTSPGSRKMVLPEKQADDEK